MAMTGKLVVDAHVHGHDGALSAEYSLCRLIQYRKEGCNAPLFPVLNQLEHRYILLEK